MTPELQNQLQLSLPPFDGYCIHSAGDLTLSQLRELLLLSSSVLKLRYPTIHSFHDWHEHDGFIIDPKQDSWAVAGEQVSPETA